MNEWISVKDRLPEHGGEYLIIQTGSIELAIFCDEEWYPSCYCFACINNKPDPSYWMPLPAHPEKNNG